MQLTFQPIGILHTPFHQPTGMPIQPSSQATREGHAEIFPQFAAGLKDLEGFSHIILIYFFHEQKKRELIVQPFLDDSSHGVFATRAPSRPNPVGLSVVPLARRSGNILYLENLDMLDGTPLLDVKPYVPDFDEYKHVETGWLDHKHAKMKHADDRFAGV